MLFYAKTTIFNDMILKLTSISKLEKFAFFPSIVPI